MYKKYVNIMNKLNVIRIYVFLVFRTSSAMTCSLRVLQAGTARPFDLEYSIVSGAQGGLPSLRPNGHASVARDTAQMAPQLVFLQLRPTVDSRATQPSVQPSVVKPLHAPHECSTRSSMAALAGARLLAESHATGS